MRSQIVPILVGALVVSFAGCTMDGGDAGGDAEPQTDEAQTDEAQTDADVEAERAQWAEAVNGACRSHGDALTVVIRDLPATVEQDGLGAGAAQMTEAAEEAVDELRQAEPASGDEEQAASLVGGYEEAWTLEAQAVAAPYRKQERRFARLMDDSEAARAEADSLAAELGADDCAKEQAGPYAGRGGLGAVRWGLRVSELCRARTQAWRKLRPTDTAGFDRVEAQFLAQLKTLPAPEPYAKRVAKLRTQFEEFVASSQRGDYERSNQLSETTTTLMYDLGLDMGFQRFCSPKTTG